MSAHIHDSYSDPANNEGLLAIQGRGIESLDQDSERIQNLALESLLFRSDETQSKEVISASVDIEGFNNVDVISDIQKEHLDKLDSRISEDDLSDKELAEMFGVDLDDNELVALLEINKKDMDEVDESSFQKKILKNHNLEISTKKVHDRLISSDDVAVIIKKGNKHYVKQLSNEYVRNNLDKIEGILERGKIRILDSAEDELKECIKLGEFEIYESIHPDLVESLLSGEVKIEIITKEELNSHVKTLYVTLLGIKISDIATDNLQGTERRKIPLSNQITRMTSLKDRPELLRTVMVVIPKILMNGRFSSLLINLEKAFNNLNEIKKNEEKQEIQREVLITFLRLKRLQNELLSGDLKKEKIWLENTTSFLRYLLKKDRILIKLNITSNNSFSQPD